MTIDHWEHALCYMCSYIVPNFVTLVSMSAYICPAQNWVP